MKSSRPLLYFLVATAWALVSSGGCGPAPDTCEGAQLALDEAADECGTEPIDMQCDYVGGEGCMIDDCACYYQTISESAKCVNGQVVADFRGEC